VEIKPLRTTQITMPVSHKTMPIANNQLHFTKIKVRQPDT